MSYQAISVGGPTDVVCRYGTSGLAFRGPKQPLEQGYIACIGGDETFGRFVEAPFPAVLEDRLTRRCVNFGSLFCGIDAMVHDSGLIDLANGAGLCVVQLPSAVSQSNRFYRVHVRRNDRFLAPTAELVALFPEVDFTEVHFVQHLLQRLRSVSEARFEKITQELQQQWLQSMNQILDQIETPTILLWLQINRGAFDCAPIETSMVQALQHRTQDIVTVPVQVSGESDELEDMLFGTLQQPIAEHMLGPAAHRHIAEALTWSINSQG
ncbi:MULTISPECIES: DUF6473 family protein [unclassified Ruegeria]|uniref:DUF6473 family protein n=1 Tax=unclassified Ruegeria TaxID=2625375 RepID=UPI0020C2DCB0|nr:MULTISPECIES: DUF6473 family protein [unclassified Ruegeria]